MSQLQHQAPPDSRQTSRCGKALRALFVALGPVSLVGYLLVHTWLNLTGACYNLVIESLLNRTLTRPVHLPTWAVYAFSPLIVCLAPLAGLIQAIIGLSKWLTAAVVRLGTWQTGITAKPLAGALGAVWLLLFFWIVVACISPASGWWLLGRQMPGVSDYRTAHAMQMTLGELPAAMQARRQALIAPTAQARDRLERLVFTTIVEVYQRTPTPEDVQRASRMWADDLRDDSVPLPYMPATVQRYLAGLPWYYELPSTWYYQGTIQTSDEQGRSAFLFGSLALAILLLIRWPGLGAITRGGSLGLAQYAVRVGLAAAMVIAVFAGDHPQIETKAGQAAGLLVALMVVALVYWLTWQASRYWRLPRQYSPFLAMRLLERKRIAFFSLGAVTLCVAMVLIVVSVMGGFLDMVKDRSHHLMGDLIMDNGTTQGFPYYQPFIDKIKTWPEIQAATPVIQSFGLLQLPGQSTDKTKPVHVMGIRLDELDCVNNFKTNLFYEQWYPGTTSLTEQAQPFYGIDPKGRPVLPAEFENALQDSPAWQELRKDPFKSLRYARLPDRPRNTFPGPGVFDINPDLQDADPDWPLKPAWGSQRLPGIIIGRDLIARRNETGDYDRLSQYPRGCRVILTLAPLTPAGRLSPNSTPVNKPLRYADDSRTGVYEVDSSHVYIDFDLLQGMLNMQGGTRVTRPDADPSAPSPRVTASTQPRASQIQIRIAQGADIQQVKQKVDMAWQDLAASIEDPVDHSLMNAVFTQTWEEMQWTFISAVEKEKVLMLILFGVISLVAIFLILCIFYMIVVEKTRDIGIIKSVGGSSGGVAAVFLSYGAAIGVVGAACGLALGAVFVHYINQVQDWLASLHPELRVWRADVYSFDTIPNIVKWDDAVVIGIIAVLASIVGALVPALIAARKHPVESLRYE